MNPRTRRAALYAIGAIAILASANPRGSGADPGNHRPGRPRLVVVGVAVRTNLGTAQTHQRRLSRRHSLAAATMVTGVSASQQFARRPFASPGQGGSWLPLSVTAMQADLSPGPVLRDVAAALGDGPH